MKLIWRVLHELKSSRFSTVLIIVELIFSIVCYQLCFSLTADYLELRGFFSEHYSDNSVKVFFNDAEDSEVAGIIDEIKPEESFTVRHYVSEKDDGIFVSRFSDEAFKVAEKASGITVDLDEDHGGAAPCLVSRLLSDRYSVGREYAIAGRRLFVCGILPNDAVFHMSRTGTGSAFVMMSERSSPPAADYINGCIFMKVGAGRMDEVEELLPQNKAVSGYEKFVPDDALKNEFASVSGILIIGVWIAVISTVGLIANNYLTYKKNERSYLVMLTVGAKRRDITVLYLLRMPVCIGIALPLSFGASKLFSLWQGIELTGGGSIAFAAGAALVIELISAGAIAFRFGRNGMTVRP